METNTHSLLGTNNGSEWWFSLMAELTLNLGLGLFNPSLLPSTAVVGEQSYPPPFCLSGSTNERVVCFDPSLDQSETA